MSYLKIKEARSRIYDEYLELLPKVESKEMTKTDVYELLAKKHFYKNGNVVYHTIRRIEKK